MIRVLHLRQSCGLYGADRALLDLASATRAPFEARVGSIVREGREDPFGDEAARRGLSVVRLEGRGRFDLDAARAVADACAGGVGLLHAHDYKGLALAAMVAPRLRIPVVATFHGDTAATPALVAYEALARVLGNLTRGVAAVSEPLERKLRRWVRFAPVHWIPNGVRVAEPCSEDERRAARAAMGIAPDAPVVAVVGRLSVEKGHEVLLRALAAMAPKPVLIAAGAGPLEESLRRAAAAMGIDARWLGFLGDLRPVYAAADVVAMPSWTEGLPLAALESMALGRPLVATRVGELPRMLADGAGVLVAPGDEAGLAAGLQRLLSNGEERGAVAARAMARVRSEYALDAMAERCARLLYAPAVAAGDRGVVQLGTG